MYSIYWKNRLPLYIYFRTIFNNYRDYLKDECRDKRKQEYSLEGWTFDPGKGNPQQLNAADCGIFCPKTAEFLARDAPLFHSGKILWWCNNCDNDLCWISSQSVRMWQFIPYIFTQNGRFQIPPWRQASLAMKCRKWFCGRKEFLECLSNVTTKLFIPLPWFVIL